MVADVRVVRAREALVREYVKDLRDLSRISQDAFLASKERQYAVLHALQLAVEASIDIAVHICAADALGTPSSYVEAFDLLERAAVLDRDLAEALRRMARFRNRIVHLYAQLDLQTVYRILQDRLGDFDRYLAAIESYLERESGRT
jgi:uncharacterized protein YutE (UPF0331/DUF86 family)